VFSLSRISARVLLNVQSVCVASTSAPGRCVHAVVAFKQYARWVSSSVRLHLLMPLMLLRLYGRHTLSFEVLKL